MQNNNLKFKRRRSRRAKHVLIHVDVDGSVELVVPWRVSYQEGEEFLRQRQKWIAKMRERQQIKLGMRSKLPNNIRAEITAEFKKEAREVLRAQAKVFADQLGVTITDLAIGDFKTQWGSCNKATKRLAFSWRLMLAPLNVRRYVVAHEVAHLKHANHSPGFWATVRRLDSEFDTARRWLGRNGHDLAF